LRVILACGGTGGHLFPAIALAEALRDKDEKCSILFIGSKKGLEEKVLSRYGFPLRTLEVYGIKGKGIFDKSFSFLKAGLATISSVGMIREFKPDFVIGTGGYSSGPVVIAAKVMGIRTAILEQNTLPGATNRFLGKYVDRVFLAFPETVRFFRTEKVVVAGNPVRKEIREISKLKTQNSERKTILVFGGSQGAKAINSIFLDSLNYLKDRFDLHIIHQTGEEDYERVMEVYDKFQISNFKFQIFRFIDDMAGAYSKADIVICRSGATSIAEITAIGKVSILIPYPYASDNHQEVNARYLSDKGAAIMLRQEDIKGEKLAEVIIRLYESKNELQEIGERALKLGNLNAGSIIAEEIYALGS